MRHDGSMTRVTGTRGPDPGTQAAARGRAQGPLPGGFSGLVGAVGGHAPSIHPHAWVAPGAVVVGWVTLGRAASVWYGSVLRGDDAEIVVGDEANVQDQCCLHADPGQPAIIGDRVTLGHRAVVHGAQVEVGALVGIGAIVLGGARIGAGSLVAAGAVVTPGMRIPAGVLAAGVPAKITRELTVADRDAFARTPQRYVARVQLHRAATWGCGGGTGIDLPE
jgi:carbonic anhydrase/acetyltransferase-like protein (isoleucine patch superfamily)